MAVVRDRPKHLVVVGAGGNIGSHLLPHLGRMREISRLTLVDPDSYNSGNLCSQNITHQDIGRRKVVVQAAKLKQINGNLEIVRWPLHVENVPLASLRSDLILACLDSRRARLMVNRIALRLGVPWIDAGVEPGGWLARFNLYLNGNNGPCLECSWDEEDYNLLEQRYPCNDAQEHSSFPSSSPSGLGALAASLQALEVEKLISTKNLRKKIERQVLFDARHQRCFETALARQSGCANSPHRPWMIRRLRLASKSSNLADLFSAGRLLCRKTIDGPLSLSMPGHRFTRRIYCPGCGHRKERLRLLRPNSPVDLRCPECSRKMWAVGRDLTNELTNLSLSRQELDRDLYSLGLRDWDVITLRMAGVERHYEIGGKDEKERL